jgi:hypothetical protein
LVNQDVTMALPGFAPIVALHKNLNTMLRFSAPADSAQKAFASQMGVVGLVQKIGFVQKLLAVAE